MESVSSQTLRRMEEKMLGIDVASKPDFTTISNYHAQVTEIDYAQMEAVAISNWSTRKNKSKAEVLKSLLIFKTIGTHENS